jgi:hypothetical protein
MGEIRSKNINHTPDVRTPGSDSLVNVPPNEEPAAIVRARENAASVAAQEARGLAARTPAGPANEPGASSG